MKHTCDLYKVTTITRINRRSFIGSGLILTDRLDYFSLAPISITMTNCLYNGQATLVLEGLFLTGTSVTQLYKTYTDAKAKLALVRELSQNTWLSVCAMENKRCVAGYIEEVNLDEKRLTFTIKRVIVPTS